MNRRSPMLRGRKLGRGVKVAPYVGPTTRRAPQPSGVMVPTRWLKFILAIAIYGLLSIFYNVQPYGRLLYAVIGATWAFHLTFTCWMIPKNQTDLRDHGTFFSLVVIYLLNLTLLSAMLILSSPHITFVSFGADLAKNIGNFAQWMADLTGRFVQGAQQ